MSSSYNFWLFNLNSIWQSVAFERCFNLRKRYRISDLATGRITEWQERGGACWGHNSPSLRLLCCGGGGGGDTCLVAGKRKLWVQFAGTSSELLNFEQIIPSHFKIKDLEGCVRLYRRLCLKARIVIVILVMMKIVCRHVLEKYLLKV
jgi:hypothetical protein